MPVQLEDLLDIVVPDPDTDAERTTREHLAALAKPPGSLGQLEDLAVRLAAAQGRARPRAERARVVIFAGDHEVARDEPVSPNSTDFTSLMMQTLAAGRSAVGSLARTAGASLEVVDVGVAELPADAELAASEEVRVVRAPIRQAGSRNIAEEPAMTAEELARAVAHGAKAAERAAEEGIEVLAVGDIGVGNTTPASALAAQLLRRAASDVTGPGSGLDAAGVFRKRAVVQRALRRCGALGDQPFEALRQLGGFELAAIVGLLFQAAQCRIPVLLDGFIVGAAALAAVRAEPRLRHYVMPAIRSVQPGHERILETLDAGPPLLSLQLRHGEGCGVALALPIVRATCRLLDEMATVDDVG